nr:unnamed protein product [Callosobruchus analis]
MEQGLRDCCRSIRIGKILVESDADTHEAKVVYARFPEDIANRHVSFFCYIFLVYFMINRMLPDMMTHVTMTENIGSIILPHIQ